MSARDAPEFCKLTSRQLQWLFRRTDAERSEDSKDCARDCCAQEDSGGTRIFQGNGLEVIAVTF